MDILYLLVPLSVVLVFMIAWFFWWSLRNNQYDDLDGPGFRILMDDDRPARGDRLPGAAESDNRGDSGGDGNRAGLGSAPERGAKTEN